MKNILTIIGASFVILSVGAFISWLRGGEEKARQTFGQISIVIWSAIAIIGVFLLVVRVWSLTLDSAMSAVESLGISPGLAVVIIIISLPIAGSVISFMISEFRHRRKHTSSR